MDEPMLGLYGQLTAATLRKAELLIGSSFSKAHKNPYYWRKKLIFLS